MSLFLFFFFQAEDGIRDGHVTGVQTCALPISHAARGPPGSAPGRVPPERGRGPYCSCVWSVRLLRCHSLSRNGRSEERRVGKEWKSRWEKAEEKKKRK